MWMVISVLAFFSATVCGDINATCEEYNDFPPHGNTSCPSQIKAVKAHVMMKNGKKRLIISWAVNIDASTKYLEGTELQINHEPYLCEYEPPFATANLSGRVELWFNYTYPDSVTPGLFLISAANIPLQPPLSGPPYKSVTVRVTAEPPVVDKKVAVQQEVPMSSTTAESQTTHMSSSTVLIIMMVAVVVILFVASYKIYRDYRMNQATSLGFNQLPTKPKTPVSVLLVYPALTPAFQKAVAALAEFLQSDGGCRVSLDMWQQVPIAQLGPMRWLVEQAKSADRVIIICPQPSLCPSSHGFGEYSVPATAQDLYPLVLNMVASHAKNPSEMAKFWTVRLNEEKKPTGLPVQLRACKSFCLMKDLNKLCVKLHSQSQGSNRHLGLSRPLVLAYSEKNTRKLKEALGQLMRPQPGTTEELDLGIIAIF